MITSNQNSKIKSIRALLGRSKERRETGAFVVEGVRLMEEAATSNWGIQFALYDEALSERGMLLVESLKANGVDVEMASSSVMRSLSETENPQGILGVLNVIQLPIPKTCDFILIPDQIRDPGNLGALLRTAAGAGVNAVFLPPDTTDAFAPKVVRAGMGAHFKIPILSLSWDDIELQTKNMQRFLADMDGQSCWEANLRQPVALIIGGEAEGASEQAQKLAHHKLSIPMHGNIESLNASVAGSVLMFEVLRQRIENKKTL